MKTIVLSRNDKTAEAIGKQLTSAGIADKDEIVTLSDAGGNLSFFEQHPADIVFLDIDDNQTDWQSLCGMVKYTDSRIWLVLISGNPYAAVKAFEAGASDFLFKPVGQDQIERTIKKWKSMNYAGK